MHNKPAGVPLRELQRGQVILFDYHGEPCLAVAYANFRAGLRYTLPPRWYVRGDTAEWHETDGGLQGMLYEARNVEVK